ncbi:MAG: hypothetical protein PHH85_01600 [Candidatus Methanoperedens sp.]|nr:hypothetical protein [Candidatus Methanoperedens sp.]
MRYRKRPLEVEAFPVKGASVTIITPEGTNTAEEGDWIVKGIEGEIYPVKNKIFVKTYEAIPDVV